MAWTTPRTWTDGELVTKAIMDPHIRDNLALVPHVLFKAADQTVSASTTLTDDTHLTFSIGSSEAWAFYFALAMTTATATNGFKMTFTAPSGATGWWGFTYDNGANANSRQVTAATFVDGDVQDNNQASTADVVQGSGYVLNSSTGGTFKLRWAQIVANQSTTLKRGSYLYIGKIA
jgi:hypothetical protein